MDAHAEKIWQRGSARKIMWEARKRFRTEENLPSAYVSLASVHYSLVKRYRTWWQRPLAAWHLYRAAWNVSVAFSIMGCQFKGFTTDQLDVISRIWTIAPWWFGGNRRRAERAIQYALFLHRDREMMKPHTRALLLISLGEIEWRFGNKALAMGHYYEARTLIPAIESEDFSDHEHQLIRVLKCLGFVYCDRGDSQMRVNGKELLTRALSLAFNLQVWDQLGEIEAGCRRRHI